MQMMGIFEFLIRPIISCKIHKWSEMWEQSQTFIKMWLIIYSLIYFLGLKLFYLPGFLHDPRCQPCRLPHPWSERACCSQSETYLQNRHGTYKMKHCLSSCNTRKSEGPAQPTANHWSIITILPQQAVYLNMTPSYIDLCCNTATSKALPPPLQPPPVWV